MCLLVLQALIVHAAIGELTLHECVIKRLIADLDHRVCAFDRRKFNVQVADLGSTGGHSWQTTLPCLDVREFLRIYLMFISLGSTGTPLLV